MEKSKILKIIEKALPGAVLQKAPFGRAGELSLWVEALSIRKVSAHLASNAELQLDWLENFSVSQSEDAFVLTYFLRSRRTDSRLVLRASVVPESEDALLEVPSVSAIWPMAVPMEDEAAEMFGIRFEGRVGPAASGRILPAGWRGFPLRKTYVFPQEILGIQHSRTQARRIDV